MAVRIADSVRNTRIDAIRTAIALMMAVARKIPQIDGEMRTGAWPREMLGQLHGKTLAVLGTGAIGSHVAMLARALVSCASMRDRSRAPKAARRLAHCWQN